MNITRTLILALALAGCNQDTPPDPTAASDSAESREEQRNMDIDPQLEQFVSQAASDLARRLEIAQDEIGLAEAHSVTWPNSALGCPEPDMMYTQALVPGYRIRLVADGKSYHYHGARDKPPFHCPAERVGAPAADAGDSRDVR